MDDIFYGNFYRVKIRGYRIFILLLELERMWVLCEKSSLNIRFERRESQEKIPPKKSETYLRQNQFFVPWDLSNLESLLHLAFDVLQFTVFSHHPKPAKQIVQQITPRSLRMNREINKTNKKLKIY